MGVRVRLFRVGPVSVSTGFHRPFRRSPHITDYRPKGVIAAPVFAWWIVPVIIGGVAIGVAGLFFLADILGMLG